MDPFLMEDAQYLIPNSSLFELRALQTQTPGERSVPGFLLWRLSAEDSLWKEKSA